MFEGFAIGLFLLLLGGLGIAATGVAIAAVASHFLRPYVGPTLAAILKYLRWALAAISLCMFAVFAFLVFAIWQAEMIDYPMWVAAASGDVEEVGVLLDWGADVDACDPECDQTALISAAEGGHAEVVGLLLESGADPTRTDHRGKTALDYAVENGDAEIAALLRAER